MLMLRSLDILIHRINSSYELFSLFVNNSTFLSSCRRSSRTYFLYLNSQELGNKKLKILSFYLFQKNRRLLPILFLFEQA